MYQFIPENWTKRWSWDIYANFGSECELNDWSDHFVAKSVWTEFSGRGFNFHLRQLSITTSKEIPSMMNVKSINSFHY